MDPVPKPDMAMDPSTSYLPVLHVLEAKTLAHRHDRLEEAYEACKTVLRGKKDALGKQHEGYFESLSIYSAVYRKQGNIIMSGAVQLDIPTGWDPPRDVRQLSPRNYVLRHKGVLEGVFPYLQAGGPSPLPSLSRPTISNRQESYRTDRRIRSVPYLQTSRPRTKSTRQPAWDSSDPTHYSSERQRFETTRGCRKVDAGPAARSENNVERKKGCLWQEARLGVSVSWLLSQLFRITSCF